MPSNVRKSMRPLLLLASVCVSLAVVAAAGAGWFKNLAYGPPAVVIKKIVKRLDWRSRSAEREAVRIVIHDRATDLRHDPTSPVAGNPDGDVTMLVFTDYNCPACRKVAPTIAAAIADDPGLRVVYKEYPVLGAPSRLAAKAALAAHRQGRYLRFHEALMTSGRPINGRGVIARLAGQAGLDVASFEADLNQSEIAAAIDRNTALGRALGVKGTPSFVLQGRTIFGAVDLKTL